MNNDTTGSTYAWPTTLAAAAVLGSLATACMMPFVAIATIAAATMPRSAAITALVGAWAVNQLLGFGLLGYPMTGFAAAWGVALVVASVATIPVSRRMLGRSEPSAVRLAAAFAVAFVVYETALYAFASFEGGTGTFTPRIVLSLLLNEAIWLVGLAALHVGLTRVAPRVFGCATAPRLI